MDAVGREHAGGDLLEVLAMEARVARDGDGGVLVMGVEVVGEALGGLGDHMDVHAVGAHAEYAAQAGGAEGEAAVERIEKLVLIACGDECVELLLELGVGEVLLPELDLLEDFSVHRLPFSRRGDNFAHHKS